MKKFYIELLCTFVSLISCKSQNSNKDTGIVVSQDDSSYKNEYSIIVNGNREIGEIDLIYISINSWDNMSNLSLGVNSKAINEKFKELLPDSLAISDLSMEQIPEKIYLKQAALDYISEYMINNCDTLKYEYWYNNNYTIFSVNVFGKNGNIFCEYGDPNRIVEYFNDMLSWIEHYSDKNEFKELILNIEFLIKVEHENSMSSF